MSQKTFSLLFMIFIIPSCARKHEVPQFIANVFPDQILIEDLKPADLPYFVLVEYDLASIRSKVNKRQVRKDVKESYKYIMNFVPDSTELSWEDSLTMDEQAKYKKISKDRVIDSILIPQEFQTQLENLLFMDLANKPYFNDKYKGPLPDPDSIATENWAWMRNKLRIFKDTGMLGNFDRIAKKSDTTRFEIPYGLVLLRDENQYCWYVPIGWEYSEFQDKRNDTLKVKEYYVGHIQGFIYNFDFSKELYEFHCM